VTDQSRLRRVVIGGDVGAPRLALGGAVAVAALAYAAAAGAAKLPALVTLDGISDARPGMSVAQLESRWGLRLKLEGSIGFPECETAAVRAGGISGGVMFMGGRWQAAWFTRGVQTATGIRVGSSLSSLKRAYGSLLSREHALYVPGVWLYYVRRRQVPHWRLRFDVSATGRVQQIGFGEYSQVTAQEGCA